MTKIDIAAEEGSTELAWQVELVRAIIAGDLLNVERLVLAHIEVLSAPFTASMPSWALQWEGMHWWMLQEATPLFIASAYARAEIVQWLLLNGADRLTACYLRQTPLQIVGECCVNAVQPDKHRDAEILAADGTKCAQLLMDPPRLPLPPTADVSFSSSCSSEVVVTRTGSSTSMQQKVFKCLIRVSWQTPLANGAIIDKYELRSRRLVSEEEAEAQTNADSVTWRSDLVAHNRKTRQQGALIEGLQFNTSYEFRLRSWNAAGKGEWSPSFRTQTPSIPTKSAGPR